jgi:formylglycine-generating enzyme required for sulfatase activity
VAQKDWTLPAMPISLHDHDSLTKDIKFPYAKVTITSTPSGATVRDGRTVVGTTPVTLPHVRPRDLHLSVDLPPYTLQYADVHVTDFGNATKQVTLQQDKDFIAACGMPMVWIPDGGYWAAKYPFRQGDFEKVAGNNPSFFRGANLPVETISWEGAQAFIDQLNAYEAKAGKLPAGFHYSLPKEVQWDQMNADADLSMAAISSNGQLTSTQNVGYSAPNKYGLYDTIGNVWEWCLDDFDANGNHTLRGGTWLSLPENFPNASTRQGGPPKYADKFIGFRVVLVPNA